MRGPMLFLLLAVGAHGAPQTDLPEAIVSHPGFESADFDGIIEDILSALEADPGHPWSATAVGMLTVLTEYTLSLIHI